MEELNERKLQIIKTIVEEYIATGTPIGSRALAKLDGITLSAATLRNEMADLEDLGYLEKQHTSSGRVPTQEAYRLYVDRMVEIGDLTKEETLRVRSYFEGKTQDVDELCEAAAGALSNMTERISFVASPDLERVCLKRIQLVKVAEGRALVILVTDTGLVRDELVAISSSISEGELEQLSARLTAAVSDVSLDEAPNRVKACAAEAAQAQKRVMAEVFAAINKNKAVKDMFLGGREHIWRYPEYRDFEKMQRFLSLLDTKDKLQELLGTEPMLELSVRIGTEVGDLNLPDLSVVTATYSAGSRSLGSFGVIGPVRTNYARVLSIVRYVGASLSDMLAELMKPDEEP